MRYLYALFATAVAFAIIYAVYYQASGADGLGFEGTQISIVGVVSTAIVLIFGIFFGCLFRRLGGPDRAVDVVSEIIGVTRSSSFIAALCVSPFVFFAIYAIVNGAPGDPASYLLAFQNGFFCQAIFNRMFKEDGRPTLDQNSPQAPGGGLAGGAKP
ncbi:MULTISPECIES: hypothetical protein [Rhizobium]|uniref:hypothetical protein n=1 Tax=Rhizobium TaxID=379 RepID=UPI001C91B231|nr:MULTISPECIES: hypothetical protein [Rhizobium]MBY3081848.1 hypothetical protein [Rhizobium laguerreae]MBY3271385.1 hypothetical protein [Rhizobium laguerreae]MBY3294474.1 hypothetical protein [Rhizobium laguerreae]MBY3327346.1 hypothetical protein [Rhizobium laguerreae]MBY3495650.1 hypothetical protein [Rhizobium laguerreae]